jgi:hypothetical protein
MLQFKSLNEMICKLNTSVWADMVNEWNILEVGPLTDVRLPNSLDLCVALTANSSTASGGCRMHCGSWSIYTYGIT